MSDDTEADPADDAATEAGADAPDAEDEDAAAGGDGPDGDDGEPGAEAAVDEDEAEAEPEDGDVIEDGDFIRLSYTARTVEDGDLVDTTDEEVAAEADIETEGEDFSPRVLVIGGGQLFESVEEDIRGKPVGHSGSVVVPAAEAFGEYDDDQVRTVSADRIPEDERYPGAHVDIDGEHGHVQTIVGGRARVDFNHPLAGQDIEYDYEILERVEDRVEKAQGFLRTYFDVDLEMHIETDEVEEEVVVESDEEDEEAEPESETEVREVDTLYIESNPQLQFNQQWMFSKRQIAGDLIDRLDIDRVIVQEIIEGGPSPMGGMGGMMGGMGGGEADLGDIEEAIGGAGGDVEDVVEELETGDVEDEPTEE